MIFTTALILNYLNKKFCRYLVCPMPSADRRKFIVSLKSNSRFLSLATQMFFWR